jgi:hypothetical protein
MENTTAPKNKDPKGSSSSTPPGGRKSRTISPEQLEKMKLARMEKAKERRETKQKAQELQTQAIEQQKQRIELLQVTKKKKQEIKRRLGEVKKGNTDIKEIEDIIEQYEPNYEPPTNIELDAPVGGASSPSDRVVPEEVDAPAGGASSPSDRVEEVDYKKILQEELEEEKKKIRKELELEMEKERNDIKEKITNIKKQKELQVNDEKVFYEKEFKKAVKQIKKLLPKESQPLFEDQTNNFDSNLDINENIKIMIDNINKKIVNDVKIVSEVMKTTEEIDKQITEPNVDIILEDKKRNIKSKLQNLYNLR